MLVYKYNRMFLAELSEMLYSIRIHASLHKIAINQQIIYCLGNKNITICLSKQYK